jgi:hypothetical protein
MDLMEGKEAKVEDTETKEVQLNQLEGEVLNKSKEFIGDKLFALSWGQMEELEGGLLSAEVHVGSARDANDATSPQPD